MKAPRLAVALAAAATLAAGAMVVAPAYAATGDTWSGFKVVDVVPAATTQTDVLGPLPHYKQGGDDLFLWNIVRMVTNDKTGEKAWVWCVEQKVQGEADGYVEDNDKGTTLGKANIAKINRVLASSNLPEPGDLQVTQADGNWVNPAVHVLPKNKADVIELTAVQLAIWHFTDGYSFTAGNIVDLRHYYPNSYSGDADDVTEGEILARYDALVAGANADPLTNPNPSITVTPKSSSVDAGTDVVLTVAGTDIDGGITVSSDSGDVYAADGDKCDTDTEVTSLPNAGGKVCVTSDGAGSVTVTAKGASSKNYSHVLAAPDVQTLIGVAPERARDSADVTWTAVETTSTPTSSESPSETSTPTSTPSVSETQSTGGAVAETTVPTTGGGNAAAPGGVLANTGAFGLLDRLALALAALGLGTVFMVVTRRRNQHTH